MGNYREVHPRPRLPIIAMVSALIGVGMLALGLANSQLGWALPAAVPLAFALLVFLRRPQPIGLTLTSSDIRTGGLSGAEEIPYSDLEAILIGGKPYRPSQRATKPREIEICHRNGVLLVPCPLDVPAAELAKQLYGTIQPKPRGEDLDAKLAEWADTQRAEFGNEMVWSYSARKELGGAAKASGTSNLAWALLLGGISWCLASALFVDDDGMWMALGVVAIVFAGLFGLIPLSVRQKAKTQQKASLGAGLVVAPMGIAMRQGKMVGKLGWEEILEISLVTKAGLGVPPRILLKIAGTNVVIEDVYERPLPMIDSRLREFWRR